MLSTVASRCSGSIASPPRRRQGDAGAQGLGQQDGIAGAGAALGEDALGVHDAHDAESVLGLLVVQGVAAGHHPTRLAHLVGAAAQHVRQDRRR